MDLGRPRLGVLQAVEQSKMKEVEMKFVVLNYSVSRDYIASFHREGCRDIQRERRRGHGYSASLETIEAENIDVAVERWLEDLNADFVAEGSEGYDESYVKVYPCCQS